MTKQKTSPPWFRLAGSFLCCLLLLLGESKNVIAAIDLKQDLDTQDFQKSSIATQLEIGAIEFLEQELIHWQKSQRVRDYRSAISLKVPAGVNKLAPCEEGIDFDLLNNSGALWGLVSVKASCASENWQLNLRLKVTVDAFAPVLTESLIRDQVIQAEQIEWLWVDLGVGESEFIAQAEALIGLQIERRVRRGVPILAGQVRAADLITLGDRVIIEARSNSFVARMLGQALENGSLGKPIRVKNLSSGKTIIAYPIAPGIVSTHTP